MRKPLLFLSTFILLSCSKPDYLFLRQEARTAFLEERYEESMSYLKKVLKNEPQDVPFTLLMAQNLLHVGKEDEALQYIEMALALDPEYAEAIAARASYRAQTTDFKRAIEDINLAIDMLPERVEFYLLKGKIFKQAGRKDSAMACFSRSIQLDTQYPDAYEERAYLFLEKGAYGDAILDLNKVEELSAAQAATYINRGYAKLEINADSLAIFDFEQAYILAKTDEMKGIALNNLGNARMLIGDVEGAWKDINAGIRLDPENPYSFRNKALILIAMKRYTEACDAIDSSLELGFSTSYGNEVQELKDAYCKK